VTTPDPTPADRARANDQYDAIIRWSRLVVTALTALFGWRAFHDELGSAVFLVDGINLAVHEAGHMIFAPFGDTMHFLGGSLFEVIFPVFFVVYFLRKQRDVHAAMVCAWWTSTAMLGVSIYMADARARQLMLLGGGTGDEVDGHDWYHLFAHWHVLRLDTRIAAGLRATAWLVCVGSILVGAAAAWQTGREPSTAPGS
jgi:hypothetical protein